MLHNTVHQSLVLWWSLWGASQTAPRPWGTSNCCNSGTPQEKVPPRPAHMHLCRQRTGTGNTQEQNGRMAICDWPPFQACGGSNGAHSQRIHEGKGPTHHADHAAEEGEPEPPHSWWCMPLRAADPEIQAVEEDFQTYSPLCSGWIPQSEPQMLQEKTHKKWKETIGQGPHQYVWSLQRMDSEEKICPQRDEPLQSPLLGAGEHPILEPKFGDHAEVHHPKVHCYHP